MVNAFQSTFDTHHDLDLELQDNMSNHMASLADMQGYTMDFRWSIAQ